MVGEIINVSKPRRGLQAYDTRWISLFLYKDVVDSYIPLVSKICNVHGSASLVVDCKSLTLGWSSLSLYKVVVDSYNPSETDVPHMFHISIVPNCAVSNNATVTLICTRKSNSKTKASYTERKGKDRTQSYDKSPYTKRKLKTTK